MEDLEKRGELPRSDPFLYSSLFPYVLNHLDLVRGLLGIALDSL